MIPLLLFLSLLASAQAYEACDPLLVEGCPIEEPNDRCARLQFDANHTAVCPHSLWTAYAHPIFNNYSSTTSFTTAWRKIDGLTCSKGVWRVHLGQSEEIIHLESRVMCAEKIPTPIISLHSFLPLKGLSASDKLPNSPAHFCTLKEHELYNVSCGPPAGYCVAYRNNEQKKSVMSCQCNFGYEGDRCESPVDPYGYDDAENSRLIVNATDEMEQDTCNILVAEGCPDEWADNCIKLRYFNGEVYCPKKLWINLGEDADYVGSWERVARVRCDKSNLPNWWMVSYNETSKKEVELTRAVQCAENMPRSNTLQIGIRYKPSLPRENDTVQLDEDGEEIVVEPWLPPHFCFRNRGTCRNNGHCVTHHNSNGMSATVYPICTCNPNVRMHRGQKLKTWYNCADCSEIYSPEDGLTCGGIRKNGRFISYQKEANVTTVTTSTGEPSPAMCDVEDLIDACAPTDKYCHMLKANHSRVKCPAKLWLNFGSDLIPDWHEISAVVCVDNDWRSECSKEIEKRPLMCAKEKPSAISTSMWFTLGGAIVALIVIVGITCIMCLLCRKRRQMKKLVTKANQRTETSCAPSSKCRTEDMSDATVTERTEKSQ